MNFDKIEITKYVLIDVRKNPEITKVHIMFFLGYYLGDVETQFLFTEHVYWTQLKRTQVTSSTMRLATSTQPSKFYQEATSPQARHMLFPKS